MKKNYNYERKKLQLPEYGRHIHEMVDFLCTIDDREERNHQARCVISVMGNINPMLRDSADYTHKLWDHLFLMSDFKLDVDSPYPIPSAETLSPNPDRLKYPAHNIKFKHYGKNTQNILRSLINTDDISAVEDIVGDLARFMRAKSYEYNEEHPNNEVIIRDIKLMSDNKITIDEIAINNLKSDYKQLSTAQSKKGGYGGRSQNKGQKNGKQHSSKSGKQHKGRQK